MPGHRRPRLVLLVLASAWALVLAIAGLRALALAGGFSGSVEEATPVFPSWVWSGAGWASIAAAQLVFSSVVADRLYPHASPVVTGLSELAALVGLIGSIVFLTAGAWA